MAGFKLNGIGKIYPSGAKALHDVNMEASDKEFLVVVGGEASGKSTLLRVISGLEEPTSGTVEIDGRDVTDLEPKDRDLAVVFRGDTLYPTLNVFENMAYGLKVRKTPQAVIDKRVKAVADILGLNEVLGRKPKTLTAAERQRVAIGRAIAREPSVYLFDEPLAGLDEKLRGDMLNLIVNLQARMEGTFLYATKNISEALAIGTRIAVFKDGLLQQADIPANLYDYPANEYVAFYIGSPTINFIRDAKIVAGEEGYSAVFGTTVIPLTEKLVSRFENIGEYAENGKTVTLGIRPEDADFAGAESNLKGKPVKTESDGGNTYTEIVTEDGISLIVGGQTASSGGEFAGIRIDTDRMNIFDSETRLTLLSRDGGYVETGKKDAEYKPLTYAEELAVTGKTNTKKDAKKKK